jgi:acyl transferase domain-containing protein/aryl carrier-like protein
MGLELYQSEPAFRERVDACAEILRPRIGVDFRKYLYPTEENLKEAVEKLKQPVLALTSLFTVEYAMAKLWMGWGVCPKAMIGHSLGEYVAACLAGVFSLEDALLLVALRGELFEQLPRGGMLSVELAHDELIPLMNDSLSLAAVNGPMQHVVSGPLSALDSIETLLSEKQIEFRRLHVDVAAHSEMLSPILDKFGGLLKTLRLNPPEIPYISNVTGTWVTATQAIDPKYWVKHLRQTVCFSAGIQELLKDAGSVFLEVGPGQTLSTLTKLHTEQSRAQAVVSSIPHPYDQQSDDAFLLVSAGKLWMAGVDIDWSRFHDREKRCRVPLPTYPFERQHYWIESQGKNKSDYQKLLNKKADIADWFYIPSWKRSLPPDLLAPGDLVEKKACWLIFLDECGVGVRMLERLKSFGQDVIAVKAADEFYSADEQTFTLNPQRRDDYYELIKTLSVLDKLPQNIIHLWSVTEQNAEHKVIESVERTLERGFYSLVFLAQAIGEQAISDSLQIAVVSNGMHEVIGGDLLYPEKATVLGPCKVIPQEYTNITCRSIDLFPFEQEIRKDNGLVDQLLAEFGSPANPSESVIAYRNSHRLIQTFEAVKLNEVFKPRLLRDSGVYLITGGLGGIALELSQYLAQTVQAKLILIGRSALPARENWARWLESHESENPTSLKIRKLESLEASGAEVLILTADVADPEQMQAAVNQAYEKFGAIHGVIHTAGVGGGGIIQLKTAEMAERVLAPKVRGTLILNALFKNKKLDFLVLCSSGNALVGGFGLVDYCAANIFLDSFAQYEVSKHSNTTISINWDTWQEVGRALDTNLPADLQWFREQNLQQKILSREGVDAFTRILARPLPQVVVSTRDLKRKMEEGLAFKVAEALEEAEKSDDLSRSSHPRPQLSTDYVAPRNDLERSIAGMWQELFGIEQVGINDSFFDLGGHSVLATQLVSWLRKTFKIDLPLRTIFEAPTIAEWAEAIARRQIEQAENEQIAQLLAEVTQLTEDEARAAVIAETQTLKSGDTNG